MVIDGDDNNGNGGNVSGSQYEFFLEAIGGDMSVIKDNFDHLDRQCESLDIRLSSLDLATSIAFKSYELKVDSALEVARSLRVKFNILLGLNIFMVILLVSFRVFMEV